MLRHLTIVIAGVGLFTGGCASTQPSVQSEIAQLREEVASLRADNARLSAELEKRDAEASTSPFKPAPFELVTPITPGKMQIHQPGLGMQSLTLNGQNVAYEGRPTSWSADVVRIGTLTVSGTGVAQNVTIHPATTPATAPSTKTLQFRP